VMGGHFGTLRDIATWSMCAGVAPPHPKRRRTVMNTANTLQTPTAAITIPRHPVSGSGARWQSKCPTPNSSHIQVLLLEVLPLAPRVAYVVVLPLPVRPWCVGSLERGPVDGRRLLYYNAPS
jgi:hypothetical protein